MATGVASHSMNATTVPVSIEMEEREANSLDQDHQSFSETETPQHSLFGETLSTILSQNRKGSNALSSETKAASRAQSLSDRLTPLLISAGLVKGITPKSIRKRLGAVILDFASSKLAGNDVGAPKED